MKHHFAEWTEGNAGLSGFAKTQIGTKDAYTHCKRCGVWVKVSAGQTTTKFWADGRWTTKRPRCQDSGEPSSLAAKT